MGTRIWGVSGDVLVEVLVDARRDRGGLRIDGLPPGRRRTTADRIRAALINSGLIAEAPHLSLALRPQLRRGRSSDLDAALAFAVLVHVGAVRDDIGWVLATGRVGLDGTIRKSAEGSCPIVTALTDVNVGSG